VADTSLKISQSRKKLARLKTTKYLKQNLTAN